MLRKNRVREQWHLLKPGSIVIPYMDSFRFATPGFESNMVDACVYSDIYRGATPGP